MILGYNSLCAVDLVRNEFSALSAYGVVDIGAELGNRIGCRGSFGDVRGKCRGRQRGADKRYGVDSNIRVSSLELRTRNKNTFQVVSLIVKS